MAAGLEPAHGGEPKARIFISYSRKDMAFADRLEAALKASGFEVLIDRHEIYAFEDWWERIEALIGQADTVVFVLSPDAVRSDVALKEVAHAASLNKRFAPIVCRRVDDNAVPQALRRLNFIFFDDIQHFEEQVDQLVEALLTDIGWVRQHTEYGEAARRWMASGRKEGLLFRSPILEEAERWIASRPRDAPEPDAKTQTFIAESRRGAARRRHRLEALVSIFVAAMVLGLAAWWQQNWLRDRLYVLKNVHVLAAAQEMALRSGDSFKECNNCPDMVVVPAGSFMMGSPAGQGDDGEHPQHNVIIPKRFAVSKYELTFAEWDACAFQGGCNAHIIDRGWGRGRQPVINVSWDEAKEYLAWLSKITGKTYRLLSEAEYEYAARAGTQTSYPWGDDIKLNGTPMANCEGCGSKWDDKQTAPVGSFAPNGFGLFDTVGNVWEWVEDCSHENYDGAPADGSAWMTGDCTARVVRGGAWFLSPPFLVRSAARLRNPAGDRYDMIDFRVGRKLLSP